MTIRCRLHEGRWSKARRGELAQSLPVGYVRAEAGAVVKHPDRQVQARLGRVFDLFAESKVARRVVLRLRQEELMLPTQAWAARGTAKCAGRWRRSGRSCGSCTTRRTPGRTRTGRRSTTGSTTPRPTARPGPGRGRWPTGPCACGTSTPRTSPGTSSCRTSGDARQLVPPREPRRTPRRGAALLQGIVHCGRCGRGMRMFHYSTREKRAPGYGCGPGTATAGRRRAR